MRVNPSDICVARQPIMNREQQVVAYELLFRAAGGSEAKVTDAAAATTRVIAEAFVDPGMDAVLGRCEGFVNVDAESLMSDLIETLPRERVVLELLETIEIDDSVIRRCRQLKAMGYRLALDDFYRYARDYEPLLEMVDIVKIDVLLVERDSLPDLVQRMKSWPGALLAEKVESAEQASQCLALGFGFFQGYFFARPAAVAALPGAQGGGREH